MSMRVHKLVSYAVALSAGVFLGRLSDFASVKDESVARRGSVEPTHSAVVFNIKHPDFGAAGNGVTDDTSAIQTAINAAVSAGGGTVYFPSGAYYTSAPLVINGSSVHLAGEGRASSLDVHGSFDSILINTTSSPDGQYGNSVRNLRLAEYNKLGGRSIAARLVAQLHIADVIIDSPFDGIHLHNFNDVNIERTRVAGPRGTFGGLLTGGGTTDRGRSDVIDFQDVVFSGTKALQDRHGLIIDGFVSTVSAHKIYFTAVDGVGLWIRNTIGASQSPEFATFYGLEADFPYYEAIQIQHGQRFYFTDTQVHGSRSRSNIFIADGVRTLSFKGGFSSGARYAGMDIFGRQVVVGGMEFLSNSAAPSGGSPGAWAGLVLEGTSRMVTLFGNQSGDPVNPTWQSYGIQINSGADQFAITGNVLFNNAHGALLNDAGSGATRVVANNAMPQAQ